MYTTPITLVTSQLPIHVSYNSVSVYYFYCYILKLYLPPPRGEESPRMTASHWRLEFFSFFSQCSFHTSLCLLLQLGLHEGHVYWPLPHLVLVCTTLVCVLFVATPTSTIRVYYFSMCTVCGHSHVYYSCVLL